MWQQEVVEIVLNGPANDLRTAAPDLLRGDQDVFEPSDRGPAGTLAAHRAGTSSLREVSAEVKGRPRPAGRFASEQLPGSAPCARTRCRSKSSPSSWARSGCMWCTSRARDRFGRRPHGRPDAVRWRGNRFLNMMDLTRTLGPRLRMSPRNRNHGLGTRSRGFGALHPPTATHREQLGRIRRALRRQGLVADA